MEAVGCLSDQQFSMKKQGGENMRRKSVIGEATGRELCLGAGSRRRGATPI